MCENLFFDRRSHFEVKYLRINNIKIYVFVLAYKVVLKVHFIKSNRVTPVSQMLWVCR